MNQHNSVPKLNLAPKLKRPLSLWNPFDYLRLFYWILFFPQASQWYVDKFGGGYIRPEPEKLNRHQEWRKIYLHPVQFWLLIQGLLVAALIPISIGIYQLLNYASVPNSLTWINDFDVFFCLLVAILFGLYIATSYGVAEGVVLSLPYGISIGIFYS